jgi:hypothetical protein
VAVSLRSTMSLSAVLRDVVEPCLARLLRPGELDSVELAWRTVSRPDWPADFDRVGPGLHAMKGTPTFHEEVCLVLNLIARGEDFGFEIATDDALIFGDDLSLVRDELCSQLQDFIAESEFAWGELRE